jgi:hypothetical protein
VTRRWSVVPWGMRAIRIRTKLVSTTLNVPELAPLVGRRIEVTVRDEGAEAWPEGWFDATAGAIADRDFVRSPQPPAETRSSFEP